MSTFEKVYWIIGVPATLIFLIFLVLSFVGGDTDVDGDADMEVDSDDGIGFHFITLKNMVAFFAVFAWSGIACLKGGLGTAPTIAISILCGLAMMAIMASLYYFMGKLADSGTLKISNCVGKLGETYLVVPAKRGGFGKLSIKVQGALRTLDAITDDEEDIKTGAIAKVIDVIDDHILLVTISK